MGDNRSGPKRKGELSPPHYQHQQQQRSYGRQQPHVGVGGQYSQAREQEQAEEDILIYYPDLGRYGEFLVSITLSAGVIIFNVLWVSWSLIPSS
jgi:hypothetical protein